jgi:phenol hydroxylase P1 protein
MQMDLRTVAITPLRQTFGHLARRLGGDKPASRYLEGTMDIQPIENFHYRPTWAPEFDIFDASRTKITMKDWYAFKDPRQYYYGTYTLARARQQDAVESDFDMVEELGLAAALPSDVRETALAVLLPLRHVAWGSNLNNSGIASYGYGTAITQAALYSCMDQLGIAQYTTRLSLAFNDLEGLAAAKQAWLNGAEWQEMRRLVEDTFVVQDWFELHVAQNLVIDGLLFPLFYQRYTERLTAKHSPVLSMLTRFQRDWFTETAKWVDSTIKAAGADNEGNKANIATWVNAWLPRVQKALAPIAAKAFGADAESVMSEVTDQLKARITKAGVSL